MSIKKKISVGIIISFSLGFVFFIILGHQDYRDVFRYWNRFNSSDQNRSKTAISIIKKNEAYILKVSSEYKLSPSLFVGIIYTENCLNESPSNYFEEYYIKQYILKESDKYLSNLWRNTNSLNLLENVNQKEIKFRVKNSFFWTIGICKISILTALNLEKEYAYYCNRKERNVRQVIEALFLPEENLGYCAFELRKINLLYKTSAHISLDNRPEILLTAYNIGNTEKIVQQYILNPQKIPQANAFGSFFLKNSVIIENIIKSPLKKEVAFRDHHLF